MHLRSFASKKYTQDSIWFVNTPLASKRFEALPHSFITVHSNSEIIPIEDDFKFSSLVYVERFLSVTVWFNLYFVSIIVTESPSLMGTVC